MRMLAGAGSYTKSLALPADERVLLAESRLTAAVLGKILNTLSFREREVIKLRHGIDGYVYTLGETARVFGVTKERVRIIEDKALRKLRQPWRVGA